MHSFKKSLAAPALITLILLTSGCSTMTSAYDSTLDTVSGWLGKSDKKSD